MHNEDTSKPAAAAADADARLVVAGRLVALIEAKGMSQADLARASGCGPDSVSRYVRGAALPRADALQRLAKALSVTPSEIAPADAVDPRSVRRQRTLTASPVPRSPDLLDVTYTARMTASQYAQLAAMVSLHEAEDAQDGMRLLKPTRPTRVPEIWQGGEGEGVVASGEMPSQKHKRDPEGSP